MQEDLERDWIKSPTNGTITEENDDYDDDGETIYRDGYRDDSDGEEVDKRDYDDIDHDAAVKIQSNYRGYRTRKHIADRYYQLAAATVNQLTVRQSLDGHTLNHKIKLT